METNHVTRDWPMTSWNRQTDTTGNITFPQTRYVGGKNLLPIMFIFYLVHLVQVTNVQSGE